MFVGRAAEDERKVVVKLRETYYKKYLVNSLEHSWRHEHLPLIRLYMV